MVSLPHAVTPPGFGAIVLPSEELSVALASAWGWEDQDVVALRLHQPGWPWH